MRLRVVVKNPQWKFRKTYAKHIVIPEYFTFEGELKKKHKWAPKGEFILLTGNPECPAHIINQEDVLEAWVKR